MTPVLVIWIPVLIFLSFVRLRCLATWVNYFFHLSLALASCALLVFAVFLAPPKWHLSCGHLLSMSFVSPAKTGRRAGQQSFQLISAVV
jgi:hypothetical protein